MVVSGGVTSSIMRIKDRPIDPPAMTQVVQCWSKPIRLIRTAMVSRVRVEMARLQKAKTNNGQRRARRSNSTRKPIKARVPANLSPSNPQGPAQAQAMAEKGLFS